MTSQGVPVTHFNLETIEPDLRQEAWQENIGSLFDLPRINDVDKTTRHFGHVDFCSLNETLFGKTAANGQIFERNKRRIAQDHMEHILVQLFLKGGGSMAGQENIVSGDMLVIDLSQQHRFLATDFEHLTLILPRDLHPTLSNILAPLHNSRLSGQNPVINLMGDHLHSLWRNIANMTIEQASGCLHDSLNLLQRSLAREDLVDHHDPGTDIELGKIIRRYIDTHLGDRITPDDLSRLFNVSRSKLYRLFEKDQGVAKFIWTRRLRRAMRMLSSREYAHLPIIAIANEVGFTSEPHFGRVFKAHFDIPPGQARLESKLIAAETNDTPKDQQSAYTTELGDRIRQL